MFAFLPPALTWKCGGLWSFQYIRMTIPWKRLISGTPAQGHGALLLSPDYGDRFTRLPDAANYVDLRPSSSLAARWPS
ncbi:MAG: hypothetical protein QOH18_952 [Solirubrobacterales bacterium]|nr:hypothetical protein [Solirubrobacterales bacterium]